MGTVLLFHFASQNETKEPSETTEKGTFFGTRDSTIYI